MNREQIKAIALFFLFTLQKDHHVLRASVKTMARCRQKLKKGKKTGTEDPAAVIVFFTFQQWKKYRKLKTMSKPPLMLEAGWLFPENLDMGPWREFQKTSDSDELLAVVWSQILGFTDEEISRGLGITVGTVRYRVGNGLRKLGSVTWEGAAGA
jgi:hypothetical protein